jgi:hypothetical protein
VQEFGFFLFCHGEGTSLQFEDAEGRLQECLVLQADDTSGLREAQEIERLVASVQSGRVEDYIPIVERYQRPIFIYCRRLLGGELEAEEKFDRIDSEPPYAESHVRW